MTEEKKWKRLTAGNDVIPSPEGQTLQRGGVGTVISGTESGERNITAHPMEGLFEAALGHLKRTQAQRERSLQDQIREGVNYWMGYHDLLMTQFSAAWKLFVDIDHMNRKKSGERITGWHYGGSNYYYDEKFSSPPQGLFKINLFRNGEPCSTKDNKVCQWHQAQYPRDDKSLNVVAGSYNLHSGNSFSGIGSLSKDILEGLDSISKPELERRLFQVDHATRDLQRSSIYFLFKSEEDVIPDQQLPIDTLTSTPLVELCKAAFVALNADSLMEAEQGLYTKEKSTFGGNNPTRRQLYQNPLVALAQSGDARVAGLLPEGGSRKG